MMTNSIYCTAPFNGISINEKGLVRTCCRGTVNIIDLNNQSIEELEQSTVLKEIQQAMLNGVPHKGNCSNCVNHEQDTGDGIVRKHFNSFFPGINLSKSHQLKNVEVRWSNLCNLGCMYCGASNSSIWESRLKKSIPIKISKSKDYQDDVLNWIIRNINDIKELTLAGGEPMLMKQNYSLIKALPKDSRLTIITNLSYDLQDIPCITDLLARPRENTLWHISFETVGAQFEYVRNGAQWQNLKNNLAFLSKHWPKTTMISFVYSLFSAFNITNLFKALDEYNIKKVVMVAVVVFDNPSIDVFRMPKAIQSLAAEHLREAIQWHHNSIHPEDRHLYYIEGSNEILQKLQSTDQIGAILSKEQFLKGIDWYDQWNKNKFSELWPEVMELTNLYLQ